MESTLSGSTIATQEVMSLLLSLVTGFYCFWDCSGPVSTCVALCFVVSAGFGRTFDSATALLPMTRLVVVSSHEG